MWFCTAGKSALQFLAGVASPEDGGSPSPDDGGGVGAGCNTAAEVTGENGDPDHFFCTPNPADLDQIFVSAVDSLEDGIRLIKLPR